MMRIFHVSVKNVIQEKTENAMLTKQTYNTGRVLRYSVVSLQRGGNVLHHPHGLYTLLGKMRLYGFYDHPPIIG